MLEDPRVVWYERTEPIPAEGEARLDYLASTLGFDYTDVPLLVNMWRGGVLEIGWDLESNDIAMGMTKEQGERFRRAIS